MAKGTLNYGLKNVKIWKKYANSCVVYAKKWKKYVENGLFDEKYVKSWKIFQKVR